MRGKTCCGKPSGLKGTGFTGCGKTLSMKGTGFSPYVKEARTMGFTGCGKTPVISESSL